MKKKRYIKPVVSVMEMETTAIEQLESTADSKAEYYDLQGRRLQNLQKGVNIVKRGGKTMKVIIK